jgi:4-alpha-glucanotransferase
VKAYLPEKLAAGGRVWGFGVNLYAMRSARNWGMGDFTDLTAIVRAASQLGAGIVGINPLHALHWTQPEAASPYAPSSRFFLNPMYIDVEAAPEFADPEVQKLVTSTAFQDDLRIARESSRVRYDLVGSLKRRALEALHAVFERNAGGERRRRYERFVQAQSPRLQGFARYEVVGDTMTYLQFVADEQLAAAGRAAQELDVLLYRDLAVGAGLDSADVWMNQSDYDFAHTVGAPPDPLGPLGQDWGLAPPRPEAMAQPNAGIFADLLRYNMRYAGALRIDHAMSLQRLFWIPRGGRPADGTYVDYPFDHLRTIVADESRRARCLVVGEDLGTMAPGFREAMAAEDFFSHRVLTLERDEGGRFREPDRYPENALATATTHDMPTLVGWALGRDLDARVAAGLLTPGDAARGHGSRRVDATRLLEALHDAGELNEADVGDLHRAIDERKTDPKSYAPLVAAAYRFLARSPARIVLVQLDDVAGELDQVNVPGTLTEYPNWRRRSGLAVEALTHDERITGLAAQLNEIVAGGHSA